MFSVLWLLYPLLLSVVVAIFTYVLFFRKANVQDSTPVQNKIKYLKKHVPPSGSMGWQLKAVESGLRVWLKNMGSSSPSWMPGTIYSCSGIIPASQQEVLDVLKKPSLLMEWDAGVKAVSMVTMATNHDVITVSFNCSHIIARVVHQIRESFGLELNTIYSRHWGKDAKPSSEAWFMSSFVEQVIPAEGALWSCFLVSSIDNGEGKETESLVTLVAAPASPLFASIPRLTASRVAGLQDFFTHYKPDVSPAKSCESEDSAVSLSSATADADQQRAIKDLVNDRDNLTEKKIESSSLQVTEGSVADDSHLPDFATSQNIENLIQKLTSVYEATEGTDGWISVGNVKGVDILKRPAKAGERPWDCLKGTSVVCVPIHYILAYVYSLEYRGEWDDLFLKGEIAALRQNVENLQQLLKRSDGLAASNGGQTRLSDANGRRDFEQQLLKRSGPFNPHRVLLDAFSFVLSHFTLKFLLGETVEEYDPITKVTRMEYKPQWPASGRDFCNLILLRELDDGVFCLASEAVEHENCPEHRGIVRGEIIIAGFVMKQLSSDPPRCMVTYITRADLKGNLPARLVNRVTASQPQGVAVLRDKLEARYQADVASNSQDMSQIQKEGVDLWTELMKAKEARRTRAEEGAEREDKESMLEWTLVEEQLENESLQFYSDTDSTLEGSKVSDSGEMFPITEENMQLPFVDRQNIDFRTLGSQAVANLMGEVLLANQVNIPSTKETSVQASTEGDWSYQGTEKGIVILQKISPGEKNRSFLGKGMIKVKPPAVWEAVRNHMTRHVYDKMLKKIRLVRQIDDQSKILYVHHEARQCILKQSRDFVVLTMEREGSDKYVQASVSVQFPELPPTKDIVRAKVLSCGWIIEPVLQDGQVYSMVSYLVQVDFEGYIPARLMNLIARRQPLCVAYLREYLEKSQN